MGGGGGRRTLYAIENAQVACSSRGQNDQKAWNAESTVRLLYGQSSSFLRYRARRTVAEPLSATGSISINDSVANRGRRLKAT